MGNNLSVTVEIKFNFLAKGTRSLNSILHKPFEVSKAISEYYHRLMIAHLEMLALSCLQIGTQGHSHQQVCISNCCFGIF